MNRSPILLLALFAFACTPPIKDDTSGGADADTDTDADSDTDSADSGDSGDTASDATITLLSPVDGNVYAGTTLSWTTTGILLSEEHIGSTDIEGEGHVHVVVDGQYIDATAGLTYTLDLTQLPVGEHDVKVSLQSNSHADLGPSDSAHVTVTAPSVTITSPAEGSTAGSAGVQCALSITDWATDGTVDGAPEYGRGHYHQLVDGAYWDLDSNPTSTTFKHLTPGAHKLAIELVNNDHSPVGLGVTGSVNVTIPADAIDINIDPTFWTGEYDSASLGVKAQAVNFALDSGGFGGPPAEGYGHYHVYLDGVYTGATSNEVGYALHASPGAHVVMLVAAENNHNELGARDSAAVTVTADRPDIAITSPADGATVSAAFDVTVVAENFRLEPELEGTPVADVGHYHATVDGLYVGASGGDSISIPELSPGSHTLRISLQNIGHSDLDPLAFDEITVVVPE